MVNGIYYRAGNGLVCLLVDVKVTVCDRVEIGGA